MNSEVTFIKSGPDTWTARNGNYTITKVHAHGFDLKDGFGRSVGMRYTSLAAAKAKATRHQNYNA